MDKRVKIVIALNIVLFAIILGLIGIIVYDNYYNPLKQDNETKDVQKNEENQLEESKVVEPKINEVDLNGKTNNEDSTPIVDDNNTFDYVGTYDSIDGSATEGNEAYIILNIDGTYERNVNSCSSMNVITGNYKASTLQGETIITFTTGKFADGTDVADPDDTSFKYKNNKLYLIDDANIYGYYDCSDSRTFKKR